MAERLDPATEFDRHVPELFLRDLVRGIEDCYQIARTVGETYGLHQPQACWIEPLFRRALIESRVQDVAKKYPQVEIVQAWTTGHTNPYIVLKVGPIVLTESMVEHRCELPREACHRRANARFNYHLFSDLEDPLPDDTPIYAILAHVPHYKNPAPQFVDVIFPNATYDGIVGRPLDLLSAFSGQTFASATVEEKIGEPNPELKKDQKKRKAD